MVQQKMKTNVTAHADSLYAGAIGAALWGAFRHGKLKERGLLPKAS
jgi:benzoyl-CoA reductase subunit D